MEGKHPRGLKKNLDLRSYIYILGLSSSSRGVYHKLNDCIEDLPTGATTLLSSYFQQGGTVDVPPPFAGLLEARL